jgi:hypothetical protein
MRIFISHSGQEKPLVRELKSSLLPFLSTWIDEDRLFFGCELGDALRNAIYTEVDYFVLLLDQTAVKREWDRKEETWALDREKEIGRPFLLPVLLNDVRQSFPELGLSEERVTMALPDRNEDSVRLLASRLSNHIAGWMSEMLASIPRARVEAASENSLDELGTELTSLIASTPDAWQHEVRSLLIRPLILDLTMAQAGTIPLTREKYYQRVFTTMREVGRGSQVLAVSTLASKLWTHDADQIQYERMNFDAVRRGAKIRRLLFFPLANLDRSTM